MKRSFHTFKLLAAAVAAAACLESVVSLKADNTSTAPTSPDATPVPSGTVAPPASPVPSGTYQVPSNDVPPPPGTTPTPTPAASPAPSVPPT